MELRPGWWGYEYTVLLITWLGWVSIYLVKSVVPPLLPVLSAELGLSHAEAGLLETAYLIGYIAVKMPAGALSERLGPRRLLAASMVGYGAASAATMWARGFTDIFVLRLLVGLFQGVHLPVANALLSDRFGERQGRAIGFNESGPNVGNTLAYPLTVSILSAWSWRAAFLVLSLPAFALSVAALLLMRDEPRMPSEQNPHGGGVLGYWRILLPFAVAHGVYNLVLRAAFTFTLLFLVEHRGMEVAAAGYLAAVLPLAGILAKVSSGFVAERAGRRLSICGDMYVAVNLIALGLNVYSFSPIIYASTAASLPSGLKATGLGAVTMFGGVVGAVSTSLVGALIDGYGYGLTFASVAGVTLAASVVIYLMLGD
jgi:sugar phosphate permease